MKTVVLLCSHGAPDSPIASERADLRIVDDLCRHPGRIKPALRDADRLVLGVCEGEYSLGAIQAEVRQAGIDPLGIELIDLSATNGDKDQFDIVLGARTARAEAFAGSSPANSKISFPPTMNRRELLRGPPHEYHPAPSVDSAVCTAGSGCQACVDTCPRQALSLRERRVQLDRAVCEPCGLCVTACPVGAVVDPATTPMQLAAEITALLDPSVGPIGMRGIVFACSRADPPEPAPGWHTVTIPCVGMVTPGWLLAPLLMGAGAVAALPCADSGCALGHDARAVTAVEFCRAYLQLLGQSPDRVSTKPMPDLPEPMLEIELTDPFGPGGAVEVMRALAAFRDEAPDAVIEHVGAPTGVVELSTTACTGCTRCAQICPTGALASADSGDHVTISFDAARCTACAQCIPACPELDRGAISLLVKTDLAALSEGRTTLMEIETIRCESCGGPIAPAPMMERITSMLGPEQAPVRAMITRRCVACRGTSR